MGKHLLLVWLFVSSIKTGTRRIIRLDELSSVIRLERRTTENSLSRRIMRLVPVFILETNNQTSNKCLPKLVQTDNASSCIKTVIYLQCYERFVLHFAKEMAYIKISNNREKGYDALNNPEKVPCSRTKNLLLIQNRTTTTATKPTPFGTVQSSISLIHLTKKAAMHFTTIS